MQIFRRPSRLVVVGRLSRLKLCCRAGRCIEDSARVWGERHHRRLALHTGTACAAEWIQASRACVVTNPVLVLVLPPKHNSSSNSSSPTLTTVPPQHVWRVQPLRSGQWLRALQSRPHQLRPQSAAHTTSWPDLVWRGKGQHVGAGGEGHLLGHRRCDSA